MVQSLCFLLFPLLISFAPFRFPFYLLGTLLAVIGSCPPWSQVAHKLISPFPSPPHSLPIPSPIQNPDPLGFPELNMHPNTPLAMSPLLIAHNLVLLTTRRVAPSSSPASTSRRGAGCSSLPPPLGHHEYFFLRSSMLRLFLFGFSSSGS
jgi:hypothetical protein